MADKGSTVRITIAGQDKSAPSFNEAAQGAGALEVAVEGLDGAFGGAAKGAAALGAALGAAGIGIALKLLDGVSQAFGAITGAVGDTQKATGTLQAQLGLTAEEAQGLAGVATEVWKDNWGESIGDVTESIGVLRRNLGEMSDEATKQLTESAIIIRDTFGASVDETSRTVGVLQKNFEGLSASDAFDLITTGFQQGGDFSGELLDTLREYAPQFKEMGFTADQFLGILIKGAQSGAFNLDKVGDAIKELNIRTKDGSKTTAEAFKSLGLKADQMSAGFAAGGEKAQSAFAATAAALAHIEDPLKRNQIGVALFGTQWEDLGASVVGAMGEGTAGLQGFQGATKKAGEALSNNLGSAWQGLQRTVIGGISEKLAPAMMQFTKLLTDNMPRITAFVDNAMKGLGPIISGLGSFLMQAVPPLLRFVQGVVSGGKAIIEATQAFAAGKTSLGQYIGGLEIFASTILGNLGGIKDKLGPILGTIGGKIIEFIQGVTPQLVAQLTIWGQRFGDWVTETALPWLGEKMADLGIWLVGFVKDTLIPDAVRGMKLMAAAFADWVIDDAVPYLQKNLPLWGDAITAWLRDTGIPNAVRGLKIIAAAFADWVVDDAIPFLMVTLPKWQTAVVTWIRDTAVPALQEAAKDFARAFGNWVANDAVPYLQTQLPIWWEALKTWLTETAIPAVVGKAKEIGWAMVAGLTAGLRERWEDLKSELLKLASTLPEPVQRALGIQSPSKVFAKQVGGPIVDGIIQGIRGQQPTLDTVLGGLVSVAPSRGTIRTPLGLGVGTGAASAAASIATGLGGVTIHNHFPNVQSIGDKKAVDELVTAMRRSLHEAFRGGVGYRADMG